MPDIQAESRLVLVLAAAMLIAGCQTRESSSGGATTAPAEMGKARLESTCGPDILKDPLGLNPTADCTHLVFAGGVANFPRIAVWLLDRMYQSWPHGKFRGDILFIGGRSGADAKQVGEGLAHFSVVSPAAIAFMAHKGVGMFSKAYPNLRGVFKMPQRDNIVLAVRADLSVSSFDEIIQKKIPLKVALGLVDPERLPGFLFTEFAKAHGSSLEEMESWGGGIAPMEVSQLRTSDMVLTGQANAMFDEGIFLTSPAWKALNAKVPMRVLSIREEVIDKLGELGFTKFPQTLKKGSYIGVMDDVTTIENSDWIIIADAGVPDDIVYKLTQIGVEQKDAFESQYTDMLPQGSSELGQYVAEPREMWKDLGAPLHPGAERYFREKGLMR